MSSTPKLEGPEDGRRLRSTRLLNVLVRVGVTVIALVFIVWRVDFAELWSAVRGARPLLIALALGLFPLRFVPQVVRWRVLLREVLGRTLRRAEAARLFWMGLGVGWFTPAQLGSDVYRVASASRRLGRPVVQSAVVVGEKLLSLVAAVFVVIGSSLFLPDAIEGRRDDVGLIVLLAGLGLLALLVGAVALRVVARTRIVRWLDLRSQRAVAGLLARVRARTGYDVAIPDGGLRRVLRPMARPRVLVVGLGLSITVPLVSALTTQVMFRAVDYQIPLAVNVFVVPLTFLVMALPISVGSIGVRESAFIVFYGLFGVPADIALLVSLLNMVGLLINSAMGALLFLVQGRRGDRIGRGDASGDEDAGGFVTSTGESQT